MTRIWLEFDQLDALRDKLAHEVWWQLYWFRQDILIKIGFGRGDKLTDAQILDKIRDECLKSYDMDKMKRAITPPFRQWEDATEEEHRACYSWADSFIKILKDKGDVR